MGSINFERCNELTITTITSEHPVFERRYSSTLGFNGKLEITTSSPSSLVVDTELETRFQELKNLKKVHFQGENYDGIENLVCLFVEKVESLESLTMHNSLTNVMINPSCLPYQNLSTFIISGLMDLSNAINMFSLCKKLSRVQFNTSGVVNFIQLASQRKPPSTLNSLKINDKEMANIWRKLWEIKDEEILSQLRNQLSYEMSEKEKVIDLQQKTEQELKSKLRDYMNENLRLSDNHQKMLTDLENKLAYQLNENSTLVELSKKKEKEFEEMVLNQENKYQSLVESTQQEIQNLENEMNKTNRLLEDCTKKNKELEEKMANVDEAIEEKRIEDVNKGYRNILNTSGWNHKQFYDLILDVAKFDEVWKKGWEAKVREIEQQNWEWTGPIISMLGDFNKGKTFLLNLLTNSQLPVGIQIRTKGLSFKTHKFANLDYILLDTAGSNSPVSSYTKQSLQMKKIEEQFLRDMMYEIADMFIYVTNFINAKEQLELHQLSAELSKDTNSNKKKFNRIIIIHNMKEVKDKTEMLQCIDAIKDMYKVCDIKREEIEINNVTKTIQYIDGVESDSCHLQYQRHYFLGKEGTEAGKYNKWVVESIKNCIRVVSSIPTTRTRKIWDLILKASQHNLSKYIKPDPSPYLAVCHNEGSPPVLRVLPATKQACKCFISHCVKSNGDLALQLKEKLEKSPEQKVECWICNDIKCNETWRQQINSEVEACDYFIAIVDKEWINSNECREETDHATLWFNKRSKPIIIPVITDPSLCDPNSSIPWWSNIIANRKYIKYDPEETIKELRSIISPKKYIESLSTPTENIKYELVEMPLGFFVGMRPKQNDQRISCSVKSSGDNLIIYIELPGCKECPMIKWGEWNDKVREFIVKANKDLITPQNNISNAIINLPAGSDEIKNGEIVLTLTIPAQYSLEKCSKLKREYVNGIFYVEFPRDRPDEEFIS